jgi:tetratricopeptide (TPR) repeat protein
MPPDQSADPPPFHVAFKALLAAAGLSVDDVLRALGDPSRRSTLYDWRNGRHLPEDTDLFIAVWEQCSGRARELGVVIDPGNKAGWLHLIEKNKEARDSRAGQRVFARIDYAVKHFVKPTAPPIEELRKKAPSELLAARNAVVDFTGRREEQAALTAWRDDDTAGRRSVRLLWGPGGQGKTRLAAEWAADSADQGWDVLTAEHGAAADGGLRGPGRRAGSRGRLLLVDYAERWRSTDLDRLLMADPVTSGGPLRVLLLSRAAGLWWEALQNRLGKSGYATCDDVQLGPLADTVADRQAVFAKAVEGFAAVLGLPDTGGLAAPGSLADDEYRLVLAVQMAALVAVDARLGDRELPQDPGALSRYLLRREQDHWDLMERHGRVRIGPEDMSLMVAVATLAGPLPWTGAEDLLVHVGLCGEGNPSERRRMLDGHASCYPPSQPATALEPLLPDRLGEDFIASRLPGRDRPTVDAGRNPGDGWCAGLPARLLTVAAPPSAEDIGGQDLPGPDGAVPSYRQTAWTMLIETGCRWEHVAEDYLYPLLEQRPTLIGDISSAALARLASYAPVPILTALEKGFPEHRHVDLDVGIAAIAERLTQHRLAAADDPVTRLDLHHGLARRWIAAGFYDRALSEAHQAVQICRRLAQEDANNAGYAWALAVTLMTLGETQAQLERRNPAHAAATEAVEILRRLVASMYEPYYRLPRWLRRGAMLAQVNPAFLERCLAEALVRLSEAQRDLALHMEARASAEEAVNRWRHLARQKNQVDCEDSLSGALIYLAMTCATVGQREEAKHAGKEAVEIARRRGRTGHHPITYKPNLAGVLNNFAGVLSDLYLLEEAQVYAEEAAKIFRELAGMNQAAFEPELLRPLTNLCNWLSRLEKHEEALAYADEAVPIVQRLAQENRAAAEPYLATVLANRAISLRELGQREQAKSDVEDAVDICRRLVQEYPDAFRPQLANALVTLAEAQSDLGLIWESKAHVEEAIEIYRPLAQKYPAKYGPVLAGALFILARVLSDLWETGKAQAAAEERLAAAEEATRISRESLEANPNPDVSEPVLAAALIARGEALAELGRHDEARADLGEAIEIARRLAPEKPDSLEPALAQALLERVSLRMSVAEEVSTAAAEAAEAVQILDLPERRSRYRRTYIKGLRLYAGTLDGIGEQQKADLIRQRISDETAELR